MRTLKEILHAFLYHLARIFGLHRRRKSYTNSNSNNNCHGNNNHSNPVNDLERQLPTPPSHQQEQRSLSGNNNSRRSEDIQLPENIQRPTNDIIVDDDDDDDVDEDYDDSTDDNSPPTCGCGRVLKQGWACPNCRTDCSQCGRALGIDEECDRCASRQQGHREECHDFHQLQQQQTQEPHR
ncbi:hypothetical protein BDC45DRAFT_569098 [Circinella umbellata]|nr:hypothetical protein BDC45DRAFT_569098 [Circinella umbellata]